MGHAGASSNIDNIIGQERTIIPIRMGRDCNPVKIVRQSCWLPTDSGRLPCHGLEISRNVERTIRFSHFPLCTTYLEWIMYNTNMIYPGRWSQLPTNLSTTVSVHCLWSGTFSLCVRDNKICLVLGFVDGRLLGRLAGGNGPLLRATKARTRESRPSVRPFTLLCSDSPSLLCDDQTQSKRTPRLLFPAGREVERNEKSGGRLSTIAVIVLTAVAFSSNR